jgi:hypothetical protein
MLLKKLPKNAIVPKILGTYDGFVEIDKLEIEPDNSKIFNYDNVDKYAEQMIEHGLKVTPIVWKNSTTLTSGATRLKSAIKNGYTHLPVREEPIERPESRTVRLEYLRLENETRQKKFGDNFRGLIIGIEAFREENNNRVPDKKEILQLCKNWGVSISDYNLMMKLEQHYPDYYNEVINDRMGPRDALKMTQGQKIRMRTSRNIDKGLFSSSDIKHILLSVKRSIDGVKNSTFGTDGHQKDFKTLHSADTNLYSGIAHASLCAGFAYMINKMDGFSNDWTQTTKHDRYHDVYSNGDDTGIEVKTNICEMGKTPSWEPNNFKPGYHLLLAASEDFDSAYLGFGIITEDDVKKLKGGRYKIVNDKLLEKEKEGKFWSWYGKIKDKDDKAFFQQQLTNFTN